VGSGSRYTNFQSISGEGVAFRIFWSTGSHPSKAFCASSSGAGNCQLSSMSASSYLLSDPSRNLDWKTNFVSANPTEVFPVLYRCSNEMDIRTCYNQRQNLEFLDEVHIPSHAQCLSPSFTIQAVSGSFASSAESNQQRHIAYPEDFGLSS